MSSATKTTPISPSDLTFAWSECPRCFWLRYNKGLRRPFSMPGLVSVLSNMQENTYEHANAHDFSPDLPTGHVYGTGQWVESTPIVINGSTTRWRIRGKYDFLLLYDDMTWGVVDTKFSGTLSEKTDFYSPQLEAYAFALEHPAKGDQRPVSTTGLMVWAPSKTHGSHGDGFHLELDHTYQPLRRNEDAFTQRMTDVISLLDGAMPEADFNCGYCTWFLERAKY
jgi:hypothetical protein